MTEKKIPRVLVVGAGGVGAYFCGRLALGEAEVSVVCRSDYEAVKNTGFKVKSIAGDFDYIPAGVYRNASEYPGEPDYLFVTLKVLPETNVPELIRPAVGRNTVIVLVQNGVEIEKTVVETFPDNQLISGIAYIGVFREGQGIIRHQGGGSLRFGLYPKGEAESLDKLIGLFNNAGVKCEKTDCIVRTRWEKLLWNAPFNPISVLGGCIDTKVMMDDPNIAALAENVMREICMVSEARGYKLDEKLVDWNLEYTRNFPPYKTSMLADYENGRPMEVGAILGNVVRAADEENVNIPHIRTLFALLNSVEMNRGTR
jgi:2-dehydropantoate 2-reductase